MPQNEKTVVMSEAAILKMLKDQGITNLEKLVQKGCDITRAAEKSGSIFISEHYVYVHRD
jgi:hypothetical protein